MRTVRRILAAVKDLHTSSRPAAVTKAAQLAKGFGAELELFHAVSTPVYLDPAYLELEPAADRAREEMRWRYERLENLAAPLRRKGLRVATAVEADYPPFEAIIRRARRRNADLIVVEAHARHRAPLLLRLTDWELLRHSPVPVLLVKNPRPYRKPVVLAAVDPQHTYAKPSRLDDIILGAGAAVADALQGRLHAMHAYPVPAGAATGQLLSPGLALELQREAQERADQALERTLQRTKAPVAERHLVPEHPFDAIPKTAKTVRSAIVVMGAVSRSGLKRVFIGNTAERILDALECDVLVVKPRQFRTRIGRARRGMRIVASPPVPPL